MTVNQSRALVISLAVALVLGLAVVAYIGTTRKNTAPTLQEQVTALQAQNKGLRTSNDVLTAINREQTNEKIQFCAELAKAKVIEPLCAAE